MKNVVFLIADGCVSKSKGSGKIKVFGNLSFDIPILDFAVNRKKPSPSHGQVYREETGYIRGSGLSEDHPSHAPYNLD